jgi:hypothetical protein
MAEKKTKSFSEKEVIRMLTEQRESDANILKTEQSIGGLTAYNRVKGNKLVLNASTDTE